MPNLTTTINKLDLSVIHLMHSYNSELPISANTKELYSYVGTRYNEYITSNHQTISAESIKLFLDSMMISNSTRNLYLSALTKLISEQAHFSGANKIQIAAIKEDIRQNSKRIRVTKSIKKDAYFTSEEIDLIISKADLRTGFIIEFLFHSGCRISEALNIKLSDIIITKDAVKIKILGKGSKERYVYVDKLLIEYIRNIFKSYTYLFETTKHTLYNRSNVWRMIRKAGLDSGFVAKCHKFRHSTAMHLIHKDRAGNLRYVQKYLGHSTPAITSEFYDHNEPDQEVVEYFK